MGHSNEATTYGAYVHDYQGDEQDERTRALQRHAFGGVLSGAAETGGRRHDLRADGGTMLR